MLPLGSIISTLLLLLCFQTSTAWRRYCPLDFKLAYNTFNDSICYKIKSPETFNDKFKDCAGNIFSSELYLSLNITKSTNPIWSDYKSLYPGGPFVDWSYTESMGDILRANYNGGVGGNPLLKLDEELCVIHSLNNFTAVRCNEKHYRYCFLNASKDNEDYKEKDRCGFLGDYGYKRFSSPTPTCLSQVIHFPRNKTWYSAQRVCFEISGDLLNRGWRYVNSNFFNSSLKESFPLGIMSINGLVKFHNDNTTVSYLLIRHIQLDYINFTVFSVLLLFVLLKQMAMRRI